jgi:hypothetical protein
MPKPTLDGLQCEKTGSGKAAVQKHFSFVKGNDWIAEPDDHDLCKRGRQSSGIRNHLNAQEQKTAPWLPDANARLSRFEHSVPRLGAKRFVEAIAIHGCTIGAELRW